MPVDDEDDDRPRRRNRRAVGQQVTIRGRCTGRAGWVKLKSCVLIKK